MNNIQQLRIQLQKLFESMGGKNLEQDAENILNEMQETLNCCLDELAGQFAKSLEPRIKQGVKEMGDLLSSIKGGSQIGAQKQAADMQNVSGEADRVLEPLMDFLDGSVAVYAHSCEKTVLKRLLKELWKIVMTTLEKTVVLPPMSDRTVSFFFAKICTTLIVYVLKIIFKNLSENMKSVAASAKIEDVSRLFKGHMSGQKDVKMAFSGVMEMSKEVEKNLSPKQCAVLEAALDTIKQFFHAAGNGLKKSFLEKSLELQSLRYALSLYTQTTDTLIETFIMTQVNEGIFLRVAIF